MMETVPIVSDTLLVAVHGSFDLHPWLDAETLTEDAYSLFTTRARAMGWLSDAMGRSPARYWAMNDAGQRWPTSDGQIAWFQVAIEISLPGGVLPVRPVLACVDDVLRRAGRLALKGVQLLLPLHLATDASVELAASDNWFAVLPTATGTALRLTLDTGSADCTPSASRLQEVLRGLDRAGFSTGDVTADSSAAVVLNPPVVGESWLGPGHHRLTMTATVPEWTLDAVGHLALLIAEGCRRAGMASPALLDVVPASRT